MATPQLPKDVIKEKIFDKNFANGKCYHSSRNWPKETYLVSKVDMKTESRILNPTDVKVFQCNEEQTAFLQYLQENVKQEKQSTADDTLFVDVELFMSNSPHCSFAKDFKKITDELGSKISVNLVVHIGTFPPKIDVIEFKCLEAVHLTELLSIPRVELKTFKGKKDWERFLKIAELPPEWIEITQTSLQILRESNDSFILDGLKKKAAERQGNDQDQVDE